MRQLKLHIDICSFHARTCTLIKTKSLAKMLRCTLLFDLQLEPHLLRGTTTSRYINNNIVIEYLFHFLWWLGFFIISKTNCVGTLNL